MGLFSNFFPEKEHYSELSFTDDFLVKKGEVFNSLSEISLEIMRIYNSQSEKLIGFYDFLENVEMDKEIKNKINNEMSAVLKNHKISIDRINHLSDLMLRYLNHLNYV
jgi:hypothetical protein